MEDLIKDEQQNKSHKINNKSTDVNQLESLKQKIRNLEGKISDINKDNCNSSLDFGSASVKDNKGK